jgi:hypothetical protein
MSKHLGRRERVAGKRKYRGTVTTSASEWLTFKLGRKKSMEFAKTDSFKKFLGCVVDAER